ncbi:MAG: acyltransferase family protein, partial [Candidatus Acidiferrales bacterium]
LLMLVTFVVLGAPGRTLFAHGNEILSEYCYLGGAEGIALGCLTAIIVSRIRFSRSALLALNVSGTTIVVLSLIFSWQAYRGWLGKTGLNFTLLGLGSAMFIAATSQIEWKSPRFLSPLLKIGQYSYEVYLTHMFIVFALFSVFLNLGKPMLLVSVLFTVAILLAGFLGAAVAYLYSEPMNRCLRRRWQRTQGGTVPSLEAVSVTVSEGSSS